MAYRIHIPIAMRLNKARCSRAVSGDCYIENICPNGALFPKYQYLGPLESLHSIEISSRNMSSALSMVRDTSTARMPRAVYVLVIDRKLCSTWTDIFQHITASEQPVHMSFCWVPSPLSRQGKCCLLYGNGNSVIQIIPPCCFCLGSRMAWCCVSRLSDTR